MGGEHLREEEEPDVEMPGCKRVWCVGGNDGRNAGDGVGL